MSQSPVKDHEINVCTCCTHRYASAQSGFVGGCAADLVGDTIAINFGSSFAIGSVLLARRPEDFILSDGPICDACIGDLLSSNIVFFA
jgi:hypothetical protein